MFEWYMKAMKHAVKTGRRDTQVNVMVCAGRCTDLSDDEYAALVHEAWNGVSLCV